MYRVNLTYVDNLMKSIYEKVSKINYCSSKKLKIKEIKNGIVLPVVKTDKYNTSKGAGGVIDAKLSYIEISAQLAYNMKNRVYGAYPIQIDEVNYIDEEVVYMNYYYQHWGHFIIDMVSRLWFFLGNKGKNYKIVFTTKLNQNERIDGNYEEFLKLFGIDNDRILIVNKPTRFKKVIVPECSIYPGKYYTKEYVSIFEKIKKEVIIKKDIPQKIYLSRTHFDIAKQKEIGEARIEKFFNLNGYVSIFPEQLSLYEQIQYLNGCEEIACISGTLPHNIIFTDTKKKIIIINKTYKINKHQELLNHAKKVDLTYIDAHISLFPVAYGKGPFILTINGNLKKFALDNNYILGKLGLSWFETLYKKLWYLMKYLKIYNFKIFNDGMIEWQKLFKEYIFK